MDLELKGKTALVTASSGGIGYDIALSLAKEDATVIINGRSEESVTDAIEKLKSSYPSANLQPLVADLGTKEGCDKAIQSYADIDFLINNVGLYEGKGFFDETDEDWQKLFDINIMSAVRLSRYYGKKLIEKGKGRIIFISSESGLAPDPNMAHYSATKAMLLSIARSLAENTRGTEVTVNSILPGSTKTKSVMELIGEQFPDLNEEEAEKKFMGENRSSSILGRLIHPHEIGDFVCFICSPKSSAINGAPLRADGGIVRSNF